ncbi:MAG TPA: hypothetical protein ENI49_01080 [Thermoplasmatales archaeon]|nr:hypothetical protein [Thermoplasmatales archaeon]
MSAKINAIGTYILVSIVIMFIEHLSGVPLTIYHYLDLSLKWFSDTMTPMLPSTGDWVNTTNEVIFMMNLTRFFLRVLSSPIPLIAAIIVYLTQKNDPLCW